MIFIIVFLYVEGSDSCNCDCEFYVWLVFVYRCVVYEGSVDLIGN